MAQQDLVFKVKIEGVEREVKSLKDLKQAKKDATDAFLKGDKDAAKALAELKDKTEDLADATRSLKTDGVEPLTGSFGLFKEGLGSGDFDKIKLGFKGLGAAMSALPIFLVIEGVKLLIENFDELVKYFDTGKTKAEQMTIALEEQKKVMSVLSTTIGNQIKILEAQGNSEAKILQLKKELVAIGIKQAEGDILLQKQKIQEIILNDSLFESGQKLLAQQQRAIGNTAAAEAIEKSIAIDKQKRIKEASDALTQDYLTIQSLRTEDTVNTIKEEKRKAEGKRAVKEEFAQLEIQDDAKLKDIKLEEKEIELGELLGVEDKYRQLSLEAERKYTDEEKAEKLKRFNDSVNTSAQLNKAVQGLSDSLYAGQLQNVKKGSAEELKIKKKQFEVNKALSITQAIIDGVQGVQSQLKAGPIIGPILAGLVGVTAALNVKRIASQKFDGGGSTADIGSGGSASLPSINTTAPTTQAEPQQVTTFTGNNNNNFTPIHIKADVVETEVRNSMDRQNKFKKESEFG